MSLALWRRRMRRAGGGNRETLFAERGAGLLYDMPYVALFRRPGDPPTPKKVYLEGPRVNSVVSTELMQAFDLSRAYSAVLSEESGDTQGTVSVPQDDPYAVVFDSPAKVPVLDVFAHTPTMAYSMRQLRAAQTYCLRVRRVSDDATMDVGFQDGFINIDSVLSWAGTAEVTIVTWYDQSGNGNDATAPALGNEIYLITNDVPGRFLTKGGRPAAQYRVYRRCTSPKYNTGYTIIAGEIDSATVGCCREILPEDPFIPLRWLTIGIYAANHTLFQAGVTTGNKNIRMTEAVVAGALFGSKISYNYANLCRSAGGVQSDTFISDEHGRYSTISVWRESVGATVDYSSLENSNYIVYDVSNIDTNGVEGAITLGSGMTPGFTVTMQELVFFINACEPTDDAWAYDIEMNQDFGVRTYTRYLERRRTDASVLAETGAFLTYEDGVRIAAEDFQEIT